MADPETSPRSFALSLSCPRCVRETTLPLDACPRHSAADRKAILCPGLFFLIFFFFSSSSPAAPLGIHPSEREGGGGGGRRPSHPISPAHLEPLLCFYQTRQRVGGVEGDGPNIASAYRRLIGLRLPSADGAKATEKCAKE